MIKTYLKPYLNNTMTEAHQINTETGEVLHYMINNDPGITTIKYPFSFYKTSAFEMGYTSPAEMIKELKRRKQLGEEVDATRQEAEEINALLDLAKVRIEKSYHIYDIEEKLLEIYGLSEEFTFKTLDSIKKNIA